MTPLFRYQQHAMATSFEVILAPDDGDELYAAQTAQAIFAEIARLEDELSRFRHSSDIWRLSQLSAGTSTAVTLAAWDCLSLAKAVWEETSGAFDITIGPLMSLWRNPDHSIRQPDPADLELARKSIGSHLFEMNEDEFEVTVKADRMVFDLGALGKGYALDQAQQVLQDWGINNAFLNAGDSTLLAIGNAPTEEGWTVTLADGQQTLTLKDRALSGSGFEVKGSHIMNPRTLEPVPLRAQRSYAQAPTAALSDALSTAFMIMEPEEINALCARYPRVEWLQV